MMFPLESFFTTRQVQAFILEQNFSRTTASQSTLNLKKGEKDFPAKLQQQASLDANKKFACKIKITGGKFGNAARQLETE